MNKGTNTEAIEVIKRYIALTPTEIGKNYDMTANEMLAIGRLSNVALLDAISLAFAYGRAKGIRAATAAAHKQKSK